MPTITLEKPLQSGDHTIDKIELREPKAGEMRGLKNAELMMQDYNHTKMLLPRITTPTITGELFDELSLSDATQLMNQIVLFLAGKNFSVTT
ncbi:phage tail assembly protein [Piscirickettsia litoralis]|uniref:Phage tail protein n=1 Tax=Piscirickettsia litoralis TaxID=1891921 RepID=A0ABX2ZY71_9GAMM|nr:phage tail assembly protein [Piscirickettsia litoralis]ODN41546.1 hypothetical protein BGC07_15675 [Piscirickettsia litoralis]